MVVRWLAEPKKLSRSQAHALEVAVRRNHILGVSAVSLLELATLAADGRLQPKTGLQNIFERLQSNEIFRILPVAFEIATEVAALCGLHDPADRAIVATARVHGLTLVTSDQRIADSGLVSVID